MAACAFGFFVPLFEWNKNSSYQYIHTLQSISGGKSFAEILFGETMEQPFVCEDSLLRGCSLHKVCSLSITFLSTLKF